MDRLYGIYGFQFHDEAVFNKNIKLESGVYRDITILYRQYNLPLHRYPTFYQFIFQAFFVDAFE